MTGTIKLYKIAGKGIFGLRLEKAYYYNEKERKRIVEHWRRKYNGTINNCYIQVAPNVKLG